MAILAAAVSSCGGGGSGSGSDGPVAVVPAATPTPTPTSTQPPAYTVPTIILPYQTYAQLTGDQGFRTGCAALRFDYSPPLPVPVVPFGSGLTLSFAASTQTYTITPDSRDTGLFGSQARSYGPTDHDPAAAPNVASFARTTNGFQERLTIGSNTANGGAPDYVRGFFLRVPLNGGGNASSLAAQYSCIFGVPTSKDDLPVAAITYSRGGLNGSATNYPSSGAPETYNVNQSQVSVSADFANNRLTATIHVIGALLTPTGTSTTTVDLGTYSGTTTIDRSGFYSGEISSADRSVRNASFAGWFFGPQATEGAFSMAFDSLDTTNGRHIIFIGNALALK
jgi:hypothetical protein